MGLEHSNHRAFHAAGQVDLRCEDFAGWVKKDSNGSPQLNRMMKRGNLIGEPMPEGWRLGSSCLRQSTIDQGLLYTFTTSWYRVAVPPCG